MPAEEELLRRLQRGDVDGLNRREIVQMLPHRVGMLLSHLLRPGDRGGVVEGAEDVVSHRTLVNWVVSLRTGLEAKVSQCLRQEAAVLADDRPCPLLSVSRGRPGKASRMVLRGSQGRRGHRQCLGSSVRDGPADRRPIGGDEGLQVSRPGPSGREQGAGLLEDDPVVNATAGGQGREPSEGDGEVIQEAAPPMPNFINGRSKLWGIKAKDAKILASAEGTLHLVVSGWGSHDVKEERRSLRVADQASSVRLFLTSW